MLKKFKDFKLNENDISLKEYMEFLNDFGFFISLNTSHIDQLSTNQDEIGKMQQQFRKPVINGMTFFDMLNSQIVKNPKAIPHILNWVKMLLEYIEPRFERYLTEEGRIKFMPKVETLKNRYIKLVS